MSTRSWRIQLPIAAIVLSFAGVSCTSGDELSCQELSDRITADRSALSVEAAWDDILELREAIEAVVALEGEFNRRCAQPDE